MYDILSRPTISIGVRDFVSLFSPNLVIYLKRYSKHLIGNVMISKPRAYGLVVS